MNSVHDILVSIPSILQALNDNPTGAVVRISLSAFALVAFTIHKRK